MNNIHIEQGTAILFGMVCAIIALVLLIAYLVDDIIRLRANETANVETDHNATIARVMLEVSDWHTANRIRQMADDYDTPRGRAIMDAAQRKWRLEGEPLPLLWIREYADAIYPSEKSGAIPREFREYLSLDDPDAVHYQFDYQRADS